MDQMPPPPPKLRTIREEVWIAQADLFLDTDVRLNFPYIARVAAASPYSLEELEAICRDEVAPILEFNLLDIAGEWACFDDDWLVDSIYARQATNPDIPYKLKTWVLEDWRSVVPLIQALRALPPEARQARVGLWYSLRMLFLDKGALPPAGLPDWRHVEYVIREEMWPSFGRLVSKNPSPEDVREQTKIWLAACREP